MHASYGHPAIELLTSPVMQMAENSRLGRGSKLACLSGGSAMGQMGSSGSCDFQAGACPCMHHL